MLVCTIHPWSGNVSPVLVTVSEFEQQLCTNFFSKPCKSTAEIVKSQCNLWWWWFFLICHVKPVQRSRITRWQGVQWHANVKEQRIRPQSAQSWHQINVWLNREQTKLASHMDTFRTLQQWKNNWLLLHYNVACHTCLAVQQFWWRAKMQPHLSHFPQMSLMQLLALPKNQDWAQRSPFFVCRKNSL